MKHPVLFLCVVAVISGVSRAQGPPDSPSINRARPIASRIWTIQGNGVKGYLYDIRDSSLLLSWEKHLPRFADTSLPREVRSFGYRELKVVSMGRKGSVLRSVAWGFLIGPAGGVAAGFISGDDPREYLIAFTAAEKAVGFGTIFGTLGAITGLIIGVAGHHTFYIHGRKEKFDQMSRMMKARLDL